MVSNFGNSMEMLANNGILHFDAEAFVKGTPAKYVGAPEPHLNLPFDTPLPASPYGAYGSFYQPYYMGGARLSAQPQNDAFVSRHTTHKESTGVNKALLAIGATLLGLWGISKLPSSSKAKQALNTATEKAKHLTEDAKNSGIVKKAKNFISTGWTKFKSASKPVQIGAGVAAVLTLLYGAKKAFSNPNAHYETPQVHGLPEPPMMH